LGPINFKIEMCALREAVWKGHTENFLLAPLGKWPNIADRI
jgi:hypothetical protein